MCLITLPKDFINLWAKIPMFVDSRSACSIAKLIGCSSETSSNYVVLKRSQGCAAPVLLLQLLIDQIATQKMHE